MFRQREFLIIGKNSLPPESLTPTERKVWFGGGIVSIVLAVGLLTLGVYRIWRPHFRIHL